MNRRSSLQNDYRQSLASQQWPSSSSSSSSMQSQQQQQQQQLQANILSRLNMRRKTYGPSNLTTVIESSSNNLNHDSNASSSFFPAFDKLGFIHSASSSSLVSSSLSNSASFMSSSSKNLASLSQRQQQQPQTPASPISPYGGPSGGSFFSSLENLGSNSRLYDTGLGTSSSLNTTSTSNKLSFFESNDEKLATTGNIFQRRDDWSILYKLPINKQNTIHIRVEDEGPYGNDETRCFVLSHFSSLNIKELNCIFCDCAMPIFDRFPLVDGTLFVSSFMYDKARSIASIVGHKQQYINAVCLKCMMTEPDHEIKCVHCGKLWQDCGGKAFQLGTLYKFDLFAALPCCQKRLTCLSCDQILLPFDQVNDLYYSWFSEEKQCPNCKIRAAHFIKPLSEIYERSVCEAKREEKLSKQFESSTPSN